MIKCVAFWEMRYWAASMASRTAKTLFCREEMRDFDQFKPKSKPRLQIQTGLLTGRSEAVLSRNLILWFNALFKREIKNTN